MRKILAALLILVMACSFALTGCGKENLSAGLVVVDTDCSNGMAKVVMRNDNKTTITSVKGKLILWTSTNERADEPFFTWTGECGPGEELVITVKCAESVVNQTDRVGIFITSVNGEQVSG